MFFDWAGVNLAFDVHTEPGQAETLTDPGFAPDVTVGKVRINGKWVDAEDFLGSDAMITITRALTQQVTMGLAS